MTDTPDPIDVLVGRRLAIRRQQRGLTQSDIAKHVGKTFQQIQKYERGTNRISASVLFKFAGYLGVTPDYFFQDAEHTPTDGGDTAVDACWATHQGQQLVRLYVALDDPRRAAVVQCARALAAPRLAEAA